MASRSARRRFIRNDEKFLKGMKLAMSGFGFKSLSPECQDYVRFAVLSMSSWIKVGRSGGEYPGPATESPRDQVILWWADRNSISIEKVRSAIIAQKDSLDRSNRPWLYPEEGESEQDRMRRIKALAAHWIEGRKHDHGKEDVELINSLSSGYPRLEDAARAWMASRVISKGSSLK